MMKPEELWEEYCAKKGVDINEEYEAWAFCGGGPMADELLELVLEGKKFGTASIYEEYLVEDEHIPGDREYSVVLNSKEEAACVIRNFEVKVEPFLRVSEYHGYSEGEEERNLEAWRRIHRDYWKPDLEELKIESAENLHVVEEKFAVEYLAPDYARNFEVEECFLIEPNIRYADQIVEYRDEMLAAGSSFDGCLSLKRMPDPKEWVDYCYEWGNPLRELGEDGIRGTLLMCVRKSDDKLIGMMQIRVIPSTHPMAFAGHIGYSVRPSERQKGYAKWMLKKGLTYLKYGRGVDVAEISVLPENEASKRTILANGGVLKDSVIDTRENVKLDRYTIDLKDL